MKSNNSYRQTLSQIVQDCRCQTPTVEEPLPLADWEEQATELHDRYVTHIDEDIRWETCAAARRALARLQEDEFGRCADCGAEISPQRLTAVPWTERCVRCQTLLEREAA
jgi:RNA polymerase-binding transcription factor DksA